MKKIFEKEFYGNKIVVEFGELAKQANGAVLVRFNDTVVLSTTCVSGNANLLINCPSYYYEIFFSIPDKFLA